MKIVKKNQRIADAKAVNAIKSLLRLLLGQKEVKPEPEN